MASKFKINDSIKINNNVYTIIKLLGHGKGGYSYLALSNKQEEVVLKEIHHEPCDYYNFGNKIESELNDYKRLLETGIRIPKMIDYDKQQEITSKKRPVFRGDDTVILLLRHNKYTDTRGFHDRSNGIREAIPVR